MDQSRIEEMLIRQDAKLSELCRGQKRIERHLERNDDKLDQHIEDSSTKFRGVVPWRHYLWGLSILLTLIGASFTYTNTVDHHVQEHVADTIQYHYDPEETP